MHGKHRFEPCHIIPYLYPKLYPEQKSLSKVTSWQSLVNLYEFVVYIVIGVYYIYLLFANKLVVDVVAPPFKMDQLESTGQVFSEDKDFGTERESHLPLLR